MDIVIYTLLSLAVISSNVWLIAKRYAKKNKLAEELEHDRVETLLRKEYPTRKQATYFEHYGTVTGRTTSKTPSLKEVPRKVITRVHHQDDSPIIVPIFLPSYSHSPSPDNDNSFQSGGGSFGGAGASGSWDSGSSDSGGSYDSGGSDSGGGDSGGGGSGGGESSD